MATANSWVRFVVDEDRRTIERYYHCFVLFCFVLFCFVLFSLFLVLGGGRGRWGVVVKIQTFGNF